MKSLTKFLMLFLVIGFIFQFRLIPAYAAEIITASGSNAVPPFIITDISKEGYDLNQLGPVEITQNLQELMDELLVYTYPLWTIDASIVDSNGDACEPITLKVKWNCFDYYKNTIDPSLLGLQIETGTIQVPDDSQFLFADDVPKQLTVPVHIVKPKDNFIIHDIEPFFHNFHWTIAVRIGCYADLNKDISDLTMPVIFLDKYGQELKGGYIGWDTSSVDIFQPGVYYAPAFFELPSNFVFAEDANLPQLAITVVVQESDKPELYDYTRIPGAIYFPWIVSQENEPYLKAWISKDEGPWEEVVNEGRIHCDKDRFHIQYIYLTKGSSYRIQVDYKDGKTNILSFTYDDVVTITDSYEGDRDGGDTDGNPPFIGTGKPSGGGTDDSVINGGSGSGDTSDNTEDDSNTEDNFDTNDDSDIEDDSDTEDNFDIDDDSDAEETIPPQTPSVDSTLELPPAESVIPEILPSADSSTKLTPEETSALEPSDSKNIVKPAGYNEVPAVLPEKPPSNETASEGAIAKDTIPESTVSDETTPSKTALDEPESEEIGIEKQLPLIATLAVLTVAASLLFLNVTKRRNPNDMESP